MINAVLILEKLRRLFLSLQNHQSLLWLHVHFVLVLKVKIMINVVLILEKN